MNIRVKKPGRKQTNKEAFDRIAAIKKGGTIIVTKEDWKLRSRPGRHLIRKRTGREFKVETLIDESGWLCTALN